MIGPYVSLVVKPDIYYNSVIEKQMQYLGGPQDLDTVIIYFGLFLLLIFIVKGIFIIHFLRTLNPIPQIEKR